MQTGGVFKIHDKEPAPPVPTATHPVKREKIPIAAPPQVARVLKLVDEEDNLEDGKPTEVASVPAPNASTPREDSKVEVIEAPLAKKRTLKKAADAAAPEVVPTVAVNMARFIAN